MLMHQSIMTRVPHRDLDLCKLVLASQIQSGTSDIQVFYYGATFLNSFNIMNITVF